ncbi:MAG: ATP-binding cassette domain-containing protein [candidate division Zixibacteria bacterium]|nr:ATP-binding cassette domain-containing protein [candidate division Zixibacteria bacterium]
MISIKQLSKSFGNLTVLRDVDLDVERGETAVVIGRSGSGKSVLLKHILGLIHPDSGHVYIDGQSIEQMTRRELDQVRIRSGVLFQGGALFDSMTLLENVGLGLAENTRKSRQEIDDIATERLQWVGLKDAIDKFPSEVSGGMRKRAALARAIAMDPDIVLYDEPTTGLDPVTAEGINDLIVHLRERLEVTAIAVTHDMNSAFKIGDRIAMLYEGRIVFNGTADDARSSDDPVLQQFIKGDTEGPLEII